MKSLTIDLIKFLNESIKFSKQFMNLFCGRTFLKGSYNSNSSLIEENRPKAFANETKRQKKQKRGASLFKRLQLSDKMNYGMDWRRHQTSSFHPVEVLTLLLLVYSIDATVQEHKEIRSFCLTRVSSSTLSLLIPFSKSTNTLAFRSTLSLVIRDMLYQSRRSSVQ